MTRHSVVDTVLFTTRAKLKHRVDVKLSCYKAAFQSFEACRAERNRPKNSEQANPFHHGSSSIR